MYAFLQSARKKVLPILKQLILPLRRALRDSGAGVFDAGLVAIR